VICSAQMAADRLVAVMVFLAAKRRSREADGRAEMEFTALGSVDGFGWAGAACR